MGGTRGARAGRASGRDRSGSGALSGRSEKGPGPFTCSPSGPAPSSAGPASRGQAPFPAVRKRGLTSSRVRRPVALAAGVLAAILLAGGLAWPTPAHAAVIVQFADPNLEARVRLKLAIPAPSPITDTDMLRLTSLTASAQSIRRLDGLEYARNLDHLNIGNNQIRDLSPLAGLPVLRFLYGSLNVVSDISPLGTLPSLQNLALHGNRVEFIGPLAWCKSLRTLDLDRNWIRDISALMDLPRLSDVHLEGNPLNREAWMVHIPALRSRRPVVLVWWSLAPYTVPEPGALGLVASGVLAAWIRRRAIPAIR